MAEDGVEGSGTRGKPFLLRVRSSTWFIGLAVILATFTDGFLYSVVVPILPFALTERIGIDANDLQPWITAQFVAFGLCMFLGSPISGFVAKFLPLRQMPLLIALALATLATLLLMFATAAWVLVVARCIQGLSAGVVYTTSLSLLAESVGRDSLGSWMGMALAGMNLGTLVAPVLSGALYDYAGYYSVFILSLAVIVIDLTLAVALVDKKRASRWLENVHEPTDDDVSSPNDQESSLLPADVHSDHGGDLHDQYTSIIPQHVIKQANEGGNQENAPLLGGDQPKSKPLQKRWFPVTGALLKTPRITTALYGTFMQAMLITAFDAILPHFLQRTFHWSSTKAGLIFLTLTLPSLLNPLFGLLSDRYGRRLIALCGFALCTPGLALLVLVKHASTSDVVLLCCLLVIVGTGMNCFLTPMAADLTFAVDEVESEDPQLFKGTAAFTQVYALVDATFGAGTTIGPFLSGFLYDKGNWGIAVGVLAALSFSGAVPTAIFTGKKKQQ